MTTPSLSSTVGTDVRKYDAQPQTASTPPALRLVRFPTPNLSAEELKKLDHTPALARRGVNMSTWFARNVQEASPEKPETKIPTTETVQRNKLSDKKQSALAEDLRKIGTTSVAAGVVSIFLSDHRLLTACALAVGVLIWVIGILLTLDE